MGRISTGLRLLRASWDTLRADKELIWLPVFSMIATVAIAATFAVIAWAGPGLPKRNQDLAATHYLIIALFYFCAYTVAIFFNAAVVGAAMIRLDGGDPTIRDGLRLARERLPKILGWAALATTVGLVLRAIEERVPLLGRIVIAIVGAAWSAVTFFVVPVLLFEPLGVTDSVKRSATLFKQRWGEQFTGNASIGLGMIVFVIPLAILVVILAPISSALAIIVGVIGFAIIASTGAALTGVFNAALYKFAATGNAVGGFSEDDLRGAFRPKRKLWSR